MTRLRTFLAGVLCALAAACAFGSYTPLIPPGDVVLPLGTAEVAGAYVQSSDDPTRWDASTDNGIPRNMTFARKVMAIGWTKTSGLSSARSTAGKGNT